MCCDILPSFLPLLPPCWCCYRILCSRDLSYAFISTPTVATISGDTSSRYLNVYMHSCKPYVLVVRILACGIEIVRQCNSVLTGHTLCLLFSSKLMERPRPLCPGSSTSMCLRVGCLVFFAPLFSVQKLVSGV